MSSCVEQIVFFQKKLNKYARLNEADKVSLGLHGQGLAGGPECQGQLRGQEMEVTWTTACHRAGAAVLGASASAGVLGCLGLRC